MYKNAICSNEAIYTFQNAFTRRKSCAKNVLMFEEKTCSEWFFYDESRQKCVCIMKNVEEIETICAQPYYKLGTDIFRIVSN